MKSRYKKIRSRPTCCKKLCERTCIDCTVHELKVLVCSNSNTLLQLEGETFRRFSDFRRFEDKRTMVILDS